MVVDTSALVAIMLGEPSAPALIERILHGMPVLAAPNYLEAYMVINKFFRTDTEKTLRQRITQLGITIVPFTDEHAEAAAKAFERFGKGRHPAGLNFGDCIAYGLAKVSGQPLIFVGDDFTKTDIRLA